MLKEIEACQILSHENFNSSHICTYKSCTLEYKLLCQLCIQRNQHKHEKENIDHIIEIEQYIEKNNLQINKQQLCLQLQQQYKKQDQDKNESFKLSFCCEYKQLYDINIIQISHSQQFIAYGGYCTHLQIINMQKKQDQYSLRLKTKLRECKFSSDSQLLYLRDYGDRLYKFKLRSQKLTFIKKISSKTEIQFFIIIGNQNIMCYSDNKIFTIQTKIQKQISVITIQASNEFLMLKALDYDETRDVIIAGSWRGNAILILDRKNGKMLFKQKIQINSFLEKFLLLSNDILYICGDLQIVKCHIDYNNKQITSLSTFNYTLYEKISFFNYFEQLDILIVVNEYRVLILDNNLQKLQSILHNGCSLSGFFMQISNQKIANYILIPSINQLIVYETNQHLKQEEQSLIIQRQQ